MTRYLNGRRIGARCFPAAVSGLLALASFEAAGAETPGPDRYPFKITCTVGMVTDIARNVAGDKAAAVGIIGEGVDPHLYSATRSDIARLLRADVVFYSGLMLKGKMTDALINVGRKRPVFAVTELLDEKRLLSPKEFLGHHDPHGRDIPRQDLGENGAE